MSQQLIINILGPNSMAALNIIAAQISQHNCNILDSRHALYGTDFSLTMIVSGHIADITLVEIDLSQLCVEHSLLCMLKRTSGHQKQNIGQYINLDFSGTDAAGVMQKVSQALSQVNVSVHALRQKTVLVDDVRTLKCKMILSAPEGIDLDGFDTHIKHLLNELGLHGKISHSNDASNNHYIDSW